MNLSFLWSIILFACFENGALSLLPGRDGQRLRKLYQQKYKDCTPKEQKFDDGFNYFTQEICDGLYVYGDGGYMGMFTVTDSGVIFVDAPPGLAPHFANIVSSVTTNPITTIIYSHHHGDHIGAASKLPNIDSAEIICLYETNEIIKSKPELKIPECTKTILAQQVANHPYTISDGGKSVILFNTGYHWHTSADLIIYAKEQKSLMAVDLVFPGWIPFKNLGLAMGSVDGYREAHNFLLDLDDVWVNFIGGHVDSVGNRTDIELNLQYFDELKMANREAVIEIGSFADYAEANGLVLDGTNTWSVLQAWQNAIAQKCAESMLSADKRWNTVWKGVDVYMEDNCYWMYQNEHINIAN